MFKDRLFLIEKGEYQEVEDYQNTVIRRALADCRNLPTINLSKVRFYWCSELDDRTINTAFVPYKSHSIFLKSIHNPFKDLPGKVSDEILSEAREMYRQNIIQIVPYVVHELTHMRQFRKYGRILYAIYSMPGLYTVILDNQAFANEKSAAIDLKLDADLYGN